MNVMGKLIFLVILYVLFALEEYFYVIFAVSLCVREWIETYSFTFAVESS